MTSKLFIGLVCLLLIVGTATVAARRQDSGSPSYGWPTRVDGGYDQRYSSQQYLHPDGQRDRTR